MATKTVFMELPETITEMERQSASLQKLTDNTEGGNRLRLRAKNEVLIEALEYMRLSVNKGYTSDGTYKALISYVIESQQGAKSHTSVDKSDIEIQQGLVEGYQLVLDKIRLARG